ncbi:MAG TPA: ABC transporter ATP-binding protein [Ramlibacter sp.]|uniref:ABC transporter ATP-binding protein n=1 Tax=Ramlibacter sp. TaxID=1917967 RepID=UPI002B896A53|nr:ABC transporter ATP-binding protein [Ramlibacter sp.]HVZ42205.1 ABC transporter ATP-binding protein [Ramlibacter sp.]
MLEVVDLHASYANVDALERVALQVHAGQIVCLLGANGAGKSTTLNCISGMVPATRGRIRFEGEDITNQAVNRIVARGIVQVPEGREIFPSLSVEENVRLGGWLYRRDRRFGADVDRVYGLFPRLAQRARQFAGTLSGGEQQMLMIGRALMARPRLLMLDEPSLGLSPVLVDQVFDIIQRINADGISILLVEQNARIALRTSSYGYILDNGEVRLHGEASSLAGNPRVQEAYLGGS